MSCNICGGAIESFGHRLLLGKHDASYLRCGACGFLQVENPTWLDEAYSSAIADVDIGVVNRMIDYSRITKLVLHLFVGASARCIDYGGGYGAFVRRMRDLGYDFHWYDKHCENLFAKRFDADPADHYDLLTAFEVLEHLPDPAAEIRRMAQNTDNLFVSTELIDQQPPALDAWSYYAPETGQHIAFYTIESMQVLAKQLGRHYATDGRDFHLFSKRAVSPALFRMATNRRRNRWINPLFRRTSLLNEDYQAARAAALAHQRPA